jgi:solute carrier family 45 protein 1/2/4
MNFEPSNSTKPTPLLSFWTLFWISFWNIGLNFGFQAEFTFGTPLFVELDLSPIATSAAWLAGPVAGLVIQPIFGILSDRCTSKWGRRRPFIAVGAVISLIGMGLFANSVQLGILMGDTISTHKFGIITCLTALWIFNIGLNIVQACAWTLVLDLCSNEQQQQGSAIVSFLSSSAGVMCSILGFVNVSTFFPFFGSNSNAVFYIGMFFVLISSIPPLIVAKEIPYVPGYSLVGTINEKQDSQNIFILTWRALKNMSNEVIRILIIFFFTNAAYTPFLFYFTNYMGEVLGGDGSAPIGSPSRNLYDKGVEYGSLGFATNLTVSALYSLIIHHLQYWFGVKRIYMFAHIIAVVCLLAPLLQFTSLYQTENTFIAICLIWATLLGIYNATLTSIPYALIGMSVSKEDTGLYMGILNSAQVIAQLITNFILGVVVSYFKTEVSAMVVGSVFAFIGCFAILFLKVKEQNEVKEVLL